MFGSMSDADSLIGTGHFYVFPILLKQENAELNCRVNKVKLDLAVHRSNRLVENCFYFGWNRVEPFYMETEEKVRTISLQTVRTFLLLAGQ